MNLLVSSINEMKCCPFLYARHIKIWHRVTSPFVTTDNLALCQIQLISSITPYNVISLDGNANLFTVYLLV